MHRRVFALSAAAAIIAAACGGSSGDATATSATSTAAPTTTIAPAAPATTATSPPTSSTGVATETPTTTQAPPPTSIAESAPTETATTTSTAPVPAGETSAPGDPPGAETAGSPTDPEAGDGSSADPEAPTGTVSTGDTSAPSDPPGTETNGTPTDPDAGDGSSADPEAPAGTEPPAETDTPPDPETPTGPAGEAGLGDGFYPLLGNGGYNVLHYSIDLDVDPASNTIAAVTTITALAEQDLSAFNLDLSGLEVHDVTIDGVAAGFSRSGSELTVRPGLALAQGEEFSVSVDYSGTPEPIDDPGAPATALGWHWRDGVVYTLSQPSGAMTWFPSNNHPSDKATFEIRITVPTSTTAAATGLLVGESTAGGRTTTTWRMKDPMATYVTAVYIGDFDRVDHGRPNPAGPLLRDYVPDGAAPEVVEALAVTSQAIAFIEEVLGPYPFEAYGTLVLPFDLGLALENQSLPVHGRDILSPEIIAHEAAHQWLGNSVALEEWDDIWLNEGFATYLHLMFAAEHYGFDFGAEMRRLHQQLLFFAGTPPKGITVRELVGPSVYFRGAMTLHALRLHAGDETFFQILRAHYERSAGGTTNSEEFLGIVDEFAGSEAVDLVESWLYDEAVPELPERQP